jgi:hypothetical protein
MKNRKFIYLKNSFILDCFFLSLASVVKEKFQMKLSSQLFQTPEVLSMALLAD